MTFWEHFLRVLPRRPAAALAALYWHLTRRRLRAHNRLRRASADLPFAYLVWIDRTEQSPVPSDIASAIEQLPYKPTFSIVLHGLHSAEGLDRSMRSLERQLYPLWHFVNQNSAEPWDDQLSSLTGDFFVPLRIGDSLSETALFRFAEALQTGGERIVYGDEDQLDSHGERCRPWFKPRWNREMFLAQDYLSSAVAIESGLVREARDQHDARNLHELLLTATALAEDAIVHVPHILCHVEPRATPGKDWEIAVGRHLHPLGAVAASGPFGTVKVQWPLPDDLPLVSILVPTKDKLSLLRPCIDGLLNHTDYPKLEILIVDNDSVEKTTADYLEEVSQDARVRVLPYPRPYNFSAINNFAVRRARGCFLCLLNNDTEVIEPSWLTEMMRYAVRPEIGAVGAKLLYNDGSIQHAGVVVGLGEAAGHAHRLLPDDQPGYFRMPHVAQFVTAVTAACLVVEKSKFEVVGGLDEGLAVAFNDVDLCLKVQAAGWRNVYVPHAVLLHHESRSRGDDMSPLNIDRYRAELDTLQQRWQTKTYDDPLHNPNLDRYSETFVFRI